MIVVTGATGFVGRALVKHLVSMPDIDVTAAVRRHKGDFPSRVKNVLVGDLGPKTDWTSALTGADTVVHAAARVHIMRDKSSDPLAEFRHVNVLGTLNLARQAAIVGVRRFIFISSVKVNGEATDSNAWFSADDQPAPLDSYGISKMEAEQGLQAIGLEMGMEIVIVRPPLIYGPGVGANFLRLMQLVKLGMPLPLGAIQNRRSMVSIENLVDLLFVCCQHPAAPGQTFMVSDDNDVSITELIEMIGASMHKRVLLIPLPPALIAGAARLLGQSAVASRLIDSLQVDIVNTKLMLGWKPVTSMHNAVEKTVSHFLAAR